MNLSLKTLHFFTILIIEVGKENKIIYFVLFGIIKYKTCILCEIYKVPT